jgi:hypothetical protein
MNPIALLVAVGLVAAEPSSSSLSSPAPVASPASTTASATAVPTPSTDGSGDVVAALGASLATLRSEVDAAAADVARARRSAEDDVAALQRRSRELEARLNASELAARELQAREAALALASSETAAASAVARAPVVEALDALLAHVETVPYRVHARRERIEAARHALGDRTPADAAALVWPIVADEVALLDETARARQPIEVDGTRLVAEVAHVGALVFWKAKDGRVGVSVPGKAGSRFVEVTDAEGRQRLLLLFETLRRGATSGVLLVPNPLALESDGARR